MTYTINTPPPTPSYVELGFTWDPAPTYTDPVGNTYPAAEVATATTFTATAMILNQGDDISGPLTIVEYRWDFGDGTYGYGNPATHTYVLANPNLQVALRVTDSKGRQWFTRQQLYLGLGQSTGFRDPFTSAPLAADSLINANTSFSAGTDSESGGHFLFTPNFTGTGIQGIISPSHTAWLSGEGTATVLVNQMPQSTTQIGTSSPDTLYTGQPAIALGLIANDGTDWAWLIVSQGSGNWPSAGTDPLAVLFSGTTDFGTSASVLYQGNNVPNPLTPPFYMQLTTDGTGSVWAWLSTDEAGQDVVANTGVGTGSIDPTAQLYPVIQFVPLPGDAAYPFNNEGGWTSTTWAGTYSSPRDHWDLELFEWRTGVAIAPP